MVTNALTITPKALLSEASEQMLSRRVACLPVVREAGKLVGGLTSTDIMRLFKKLHLQLDAEL